MTWTGRIGDWLDRYGRAFFVLVVAAGAVAVSAALYGFDVQDGTCLQCHRKEGLLNPEKVDLAAHEPYRDGTKRCVECHSQRKIVTHLERSGAVAKRVLARFSDLDWRRVDTDTALGDEQCLTCHHRILEANRLDQIRVSRIEKPARLEEIGLRFEHDRHYALGAFTASQSVRLAELEAKAARTDEESGELAFLRKVRRSECIRCHGKTKNGAVDKNVNYFTSNPMTCASCHPAATQEVHPGNVIAMPTEETCRRCHSGKMHGRIYFFNADKDDPDTRFCKKCHPDYQETTPLLSMNAGD